jgi:hypothetical protein
LFRVLRRSGAADTIGTIDTARTIHRTSEVGREPTPADLAPTRDDGSNVKARHSHRGRALKSMRRPR